MGGSVGTALLAVVLAGAISSTVVGAGGVEGARSLSGAEAQQAAVELPDAFATTFWWALILTVVALIPVIYLAIVERREDYGNDETAPVPQGAEQSAPVEAGTR